jgi:hypothetical protein
MPSNQEKVDPVIASLEGWLEVWRCTGALASAALRGAFHPSWPSLDLRQMRAQWFAQLGDAMDSTMRSPAFLGLLQQNFRVLTRFVPFVLPQPHAGNRSLFT